MAPWQMILVLILVSLPGILITTPTLVGKMLPILAEKLPEDQKIPPARTLKFVMAVQVLVLVSVFAVLGGMTAPKVGLSAPFFEALVARSRLWTAAKPQMLPMMIGGVAGGLVLVAAYYLFFRPRLDRPTVRHMEDLRMQMGLAGRLLYGGVLEEVLTRWGLMSVAAWIGLKLAGEVTPAVMWAAIAVSGIIFGLLHIPNYVLTGSKLSPMFASLMVFLNLWASLVFGWLFWQYGLLAAIGAHMLFHLVWYPFDRYYAAQHEPLPGAGVEFTS